MAQVKVADGLLEGEFKENEFGGSFYSFKGIPYAEPPLGNLRFKAPQPVKPWSGVRSAKDHGPISYQIEVVRQTPPEGSEDCLYLNVYTPNTKPTSPLPVMVFIHGGAFLNGSGNDDLYGPEFIVKENIILVTINYRVDILGFLCLDTEDIPGNAGMKDQVAALKWVKINISNFGGDPENITIFGESAGGASVVFHMISPMSKGLFKRAIAQSGSANCFWAQAYAPRERAFAIAKKLGFESEDEFELANFFMTQPKENLINVKVPITFSESIKVPDELQLGVVSEKQFGDNERFFYGDVATAFRNGIHEGVDVIAGFNEHEGLISLNRVVDIEKAFDQANNLREYMAPRDIVLNRPLREVLEAGRKMKKFYFGSDKVSNENIEQLSKFLGMDLFNYPLIQFLKMTCNRNKAYLYKFTAKSERNFFGNLDVIKKILGGKEVATHADELCYLFNAKLLPLKLDQTSEVYKVIDNIVKLWTNFAKFGNPTPDNSLQVHWPPYTASEEQYLNIGNKLTTDSAPNNDEVEFWENVFREYYQTLVF